MMIVVADLNTEFLSGCTTSTANVEEFHSAKGGANVKDISLAVDLACPKFTERFLKFCNSTTGSDMYITSYVTADGHTCYTVHLKCSTASTCLFEPFKKLGIIMSDLEVTYDMTANIYKVPTRLLKNIEALATKTVNALLMYIASFAYAAFTTATSAALEYQAVRDCTEDSRLAECLQAWTNKCIQGFSTPTVLTAQPLMTDAINHFKLLNSPISTMAPVGVLIGEVGYAVACDASKRPAVLLAHTNNGIAKPFFEILQPTAIRTTTSLCTLDAVPDSVYAKVSACIAASSKAVPGVAIASLDCTTREAEFTVAEDVESLELSKSAAKWVQDTVKALSDKLGATDEFDIKLAEAGLGIPLKRIGSTFDCTSIKAMYDDDAYAQQLYKQVQDYYDTFDLKALATCVKGFAKGDIYAMLFTGDSGTGKSTAAKVIPYKCGIPYVCVNFSTNVEETDLFGTMIPNPEKKSAEDPEFIWQDGILTKAIRNGYCAILEEINFARPGVLGKLNSLLDENRQMDLTNGELIKAHPNFRMIATCNIAYEGTNRLNKALVNRFDAVVRFDDVDKEEALAIIKARTGYSEKTKMNEIYKVYAALKKFSREQNLDLVVSLRQLLTLFKQGKYYKNADAAIRNVLLNSAFIEEPEYYSEFCNTVLPAFKLDFKL